MAVDLLVYYVEWNPKKCVAPDVMVVLGVQSRRRGSYRVWEEGKAPDFVLEVLSGSTHSADADDKRKKYAEMGVKEYFLDDPLGRTMARAPSAQRLTGEHLEGGTYREIPWGTEGTIPSEALGLDLRVKRQERQPRWRELRFRDPLSGEDLPTHEEEHSRRIEATRQAPVAKQESRSEAEARQRAERRAKAESEARRKAERRIAELEAKLAQ